MSKLGLDANWPGFSSGITEKEYDDFNGLIKLVKHKNQWFTEDNVRKSFLNWGKDLKEDQLNKWLANYQIGTTPKRIGIIMAGNLPIVGMHDLLSVVMSNNIALVKLSSDDDQLLPALFKILFNLCPGLKERIFPVAKLENYEAVIATGSNNSSRYFEAYFKHVPNVIRKNRTSVAIVKRDTTDDELTLLGKDVFDYYGLGCRNVTKVYFEEGFDLDRFFKAIYGFSDVANMNKYANDLDYHKTLFLLNSVKFLENGFLILREEKDFYSPIGVLHYEYFQSEEAVLKTIASNSDQIQCIVGSNHIPYGKSQQPSLTDYADGVDTMEFLTSL
ncbi:MAG: acyl-CoA reductase [Flavobacteriales bacterium]|nr:acyl-CoA reductase [Flavobacteriales bacterium]